ncbi:MAG TPA: cysteine--tRNA ligase, partial [Mycobacteriales bacterium]|nr:cysteine--tRNA ligase [Mycobacteriales bacterium]
MALRLYDTRTRAVRDFEPVLPGVVTLYVCGPTVQSAPHIGHVRSAVAFDVVRRWLTASGHEVHHVRNVTDIDDKILVNADAQGVPWWALATSVTREFHAAYTALNCLPPTGEPRATGHIPEMVALIQRLIDAGHAYPSGGDVYFDVRSHPAYGELSGQQPDAMQSGEDGTAAKRSPLDFALWKAAKPGEPYWDTPWGPGRPGWHIECSAMATKYLGPTFDIHGGGLDLVFPHHENELAQSSAAGDGFARFWLHHGLLNTGGTKMSKSLGNSLFVADLLGEVRAQAVRYHLVAPHYRSESEWSDAGLAESEAAYSRIENFLTRAAERFPDVPAAPAFPAEFAAAMDEDIAVPAALGVLHDTVRRGNSALADGDEATARAAYADAAAMTDVLGLAPADFAGGAESSLSRIVEALMPALLASRQAARERKDFAESDRIRDALAAAGIIVEDTADGPR